MSKLSQFILCNPLKNKPSLAYKFLFLKAFVIFQHIENVCFKLAFEIANRQCFFPDSLCLTKIYENVTCRFQTRRLTQHMFQHML